VGRAIEHLRKTMSESVLFADLPSFSFQLNPVLVVENFWSQEDREFFREGMHQAAWKGLDDLPKVRLDFPHAGNWAKAEIGLAHGQRLLACLELPCIQAYMESFPNITGRHVGFNYYSYAAGDCLLTHDDTDQGYEIGGVPAPRRRIALVSYFHDEWRSDWGGELIIYAKRKGHRAAQPDLEVTHCIEPRPGSLVMFTVPRFHRVCRVDRVAGNERRLSIAGWFMSDHS
jgi:SM-20-related protein